jgi:hypothetical protein
MFGKTKKLEHVNLLQCDDVTPGVVVEIARSLDEEKKQFIKRSNEFHDGEHAHRFWLDTLEQAIKNNCGMQSLELANKALDRYREIKETIPTGHDWSDELVEMINKLEDDQCPK